MSTRSASALLALASTGAGCVTAVHITHESTLAVDARAPDFTLTSQHGDAVSLASAVTQGPVALIFYRGFW